eukprot:TRINITY_DN23977_c0_g1_i2.p1 TRINITY_DN23977_c0_g1~~TRINITY_DN23977_c0_g1_i2.p1  ORF type:complete len:269 (+),score=64.87 TRINITY_DN23977_c0_g1_i2:217-1023(+)
MTMAELRDLLFSINNNDSFSPQELSKAVKGKRKQLFRDALREHGIDWKELLTRVANRMVVEVPDVLAMQQQDTDDGQMLPSPSRQPPSSCSSREFHTEAVCTLDGSKFRVLPLMEGKWSGEAQSYAGGLLEKRESTSTRLTWEPESKSWSLLRLLGDESGAAIVTKFKLAPVGHGMVSGTAEITDGSQSASWLRDATLTIREEDSSPASLVLQMHSSTGQLMVLESVVFLSASSLLRTSQLFAPFEDQDGAQSLQFRSVVVNSETKVA